MLLYLPHLRTVPGWYGDETTALLIGKQLFNGEMAFGAVSNTFVTVVFQPLYLAMVGFGYWLTSDILGARFLNTLLAYGTALTIYGIGRRIFPSRIAFGGALLFLVCDQSVIHFRQCFPHNAVAFGAAIAILSICRRSERKGANLSAGLGVAVALGAHPLGVYLAAVTGCFRLLRPRSWIPLILPSLILIAGCYSLVAIRHSNWLIDDIQTIFHSYSAGNSEQEGHLWTNLSRFYSQNIFHFLAFASCLLLLLSPRRVRRLPILAFVLLFSIALFRNRANLVVFYYQAVPLLPFLCLALSWSCNTAVTRLIRMGPLGTVTPAISRAIRRCAFPLLILALAAPLAGKSIQGTLIPRNMMWTTQSTEEVDKAAAWLNTRLAPTDIVIANPNLAWLLNSRTANMLQLTAWNGKDTFMYEYGMPKDRFIFPLDRSSIRYLVLGDIDQIWGIHQPNVLSILEEYDVEGWRLVWKSPTYLILENPSFSRHQTNRTTAP